MKFVPLFLILAIPTISLGDQIQLELTFLEGDLGYSASAVLLVEDLNNDGLITADAGFYDIYSGPSEVEEASIDFSVNGTLVESYDNADNFDLTYDFFIFGYDIAANEILNVDIGADPGIYAFFVPTFGNDPNGQFFNTSNNDLGLFGGIVVSSISIPEPNGGLIALAFLIATTGLRTRNGNFSENQIAG